LFKREDHAAEVGILLFQTDFKGAFGIPDREIISRLHGSAPAGPRI
jgi:hypothetical protein